MELTHLQEFVALSEKESFTKAAEMLEMSQSLLSKHIRALEQELKLPLFIRNRRSVALSEEGKAFLPYARRMLETQRECESVLSMFRGEGPQRLRIGATVDLKQYGVLDLIAGFLRKYPEVEVNLIEGPSKGHIKALYDKERDFVFTYGDDSPYEEIERVTLLDDFLVAVLPADHPLSEMETLSFEDLKMEEFYSVDKGSHSYRQFMSLCREAGFEPDIVYTSNSMKHLVEMIKRGRGVAVARSRQVGVWNSRLIRVVKIVPEVKTSICFFHNTAMTRNRAMERFYQFVISETENVRKTYGEEEAAGRTTVGSETPGEEA